MKNIILSVTCLLAVLIGMAVWLSVDEARNAPEETTTRRTTHQTTTELTEAPTPTPEPTEENVLAYKPLSDERKKKFVVCERYQNALHVALTTSNGYIKVTGTVINIKEDDSTRAMEKYMSFFCQEFKIIEEKTGNVFSGSWVIYKGVNDDMKLLEGDYVTVYGVDITYDMQPHNEKGLLLAIEDIDFLN